MSLAPEQVPAVSFQKAYVETVDVMLERAGCTKIRMEALHCEYNFIAARAENVEWRKHFHVNGFNDDVFEVGAPRQSACNDPTTWIILYGIFGGMRAPRPVPAEPAILRRFASYEEEAASVAVTETAFAEYFKGKVGGWRTLRPDVETLHNGTEVWREGEKKEEDEEVLILINHSQPFALHGKLCRVLGICSDYRM
jgi:hypothetical protein